MLGLWEDGGTARLKTGRSFHTLTKSKGPKVIDFKKDAHIHLHIHVK